MGADNLQREGDYEEFVLVSGAGEELAYYQITPDYTPWHGSVDQAQDIWERARSGDVLTAYDIECVQAFFKLAAEQFAEAMQTLLVSFVNAADGIVDFFKILQTESDSDEAEASSDAVTQPTI